jgi:cardiolipin synthase A/B
MPRIERLDEPGRGPARHYIKEAVLETALYSAIVVAGVGLNVGSAMHALLNKRDSRSQLGWVTLCLFLPFVGSAFYWLVGNNRIRTRARAWQVEGRFRSGSRTDRAVSRLASQHPEEADTLRRLLEISARVTGRPLVGGNQVEPLYDGEGAYPVMLAAIEQATRSIVLSTYLFDTDETGRGFVDALGRAAARGVDVRLLIDAIGERYARPRVTRLLRAHPEVKVARFLPFKLGLPMLAANLRNHRKLLAIDGDLAFTGGMNIGGRHMVAAPGNRTPTSDVHFRVRGPVVLDLIESFEEDWAFATGVAQERSAERPAEPRPVGTALCRAIKDGPNEDFERLQWILIGALTCATRSVRIMTPYFIPGRELITAINSAALHGAEVEIILPARSNLPFVDWACREHLPEVMGYGARIYLQPAPFNHGKLLLVDGLYVNLGSANLDPRSLRLNFELNLEVFDVELAGKLGRYLDGVRARCEQLTEAALAGRSLGTRLRDATAKLFSPYL